MVDHNGNGKMVVLPYPSNERMKQHDEVNPLSGLSRYMLSYLPRFGDIEI
jgi:hypothetical protein